MSSSSAQYQNRFYVALLHPRYWGQWLAVGLLYLLTWLPIGLKNRLGAALAGWLTRRRFMQKRRHIVLTNLRLCLPELSDAQREHLFGQNVRAFCQTMLTMGELAWRSPAFIARRLHLEDQGRLAQLRSSGQPLIFLAPHTFALDWTARALILAGFAMSNIFKPTGKPVFDYMMFKSRTRQGGTQFTRGEGLGVLVKSIRSGHPCLYVADEDYGTDGVVFAPFFATEKSTLPTLGRMVRAARATVVPVTCGYDPDSSQFVLHVAEPLSQVPSDEQGSAEAMNHAYEALIERFPADFMWSLRLLRRRDGSRPY
ncbi:hypothetical protein [Gallaecimonas sp. GXIMD1310]|uniref:LpxL/LpxP family acyltransferase n=1 Tax=Gallaecimonas sp. GXIMD1310 TaxID=3131926 RepID=UPI003254DF6E